MTAALPRRRRGPGPEAGEDGLIWADLWINIAFVLFALVSDPSTSWLLDDVRLLTEGSQAAPETVLVLHLVPGPDGLPLLRETSADGPVLGDDAADEVLSRALEADPDTTVLLAAAAELPAGALLEVVARLEGAGVGAITIAQSVDEGD